ncbi:MAG: cell division protein ZapA [Novosphingobium sp.]
MSNVSLLIGGRQFTVACAKGEEDHVEALGQLIDAKLTAMGGAGNQSETRMLLFAALMLADEVFELRSQRCDVAPATPASDDMVAQLDRIAERLENLAASLEERAPPA